MNNQPKKSLWLNSRLTNFFLGSLLIGLPIFTTVEANANMHQEFMPQTEMGTETDAMESESGVYNDTDGGYDGEPIATITPAEGTVNVMVKNKTNAAIDYQAIGYTENQTLEDEKEHTMKNLPLPVVIRMARQDDGFIKISSLNGGSEAGMLEVSLNEDADFDDNNNVSVIRIEEDGSVYLN